MTICIFLALQEFEDGRVMFRRYAFDGETGEEVQPPGGAFQKQTLLAFEWLHSAGLPTLKDGEISTRTTPKTAPEPFEAIHHEPTRIPAAQH